MNDITTLRTWFDKFHEETGERPSHYLLGRDHQWRPKWNEMWDDSGKVVTSLPDNILDREFDDGFGGNASPDLCAWSDNWVLFSDNYDGAESLCWVPRSPVEHTPIRPGGG